MEKLTKLFLIITAILMLCGTGTFLFAGTNNDEIVEPEASGCYQSYGYCSDWQMNWKCITTYTAERCYKHACSECPESGTIE